MIKGFQKRKAGQAMVEYIIIVVVVAIAALVIFGVFGDKIQSMTKGAVEELGGSSSDDNETRGSTEFLQGLGKDAD